MAMKFKVTFSQLPTNPPLRGEVVLPITDIDQTYTLTFNLTENCSTTDKFIGLWKETVQPEAYNCGYNFYPTINESMFIAMKERMNWIIETIKTMNDMPNVDESLVLNENSLDIEILKLNALHLYFENVSNMPEINTSNAYCQHKETYIYLEEINQLVHSMEGWEPPSLLEFFGTIRVNEGKDGGWITLPLTDEDYNNFTIYHDWGDLTLDYFRVGKDLMASFATGDFKLIKTKGLCQQNTVHTCFEMRFQQRGISEEPYYPIDLLNKWCDENNVRDYYNLDLPMFNSGRVKLGKIDMTGTTKDEVMSELVKCTSLTNVELINE